MNATDGAGGANQKTAVECRGDELARLEKENSQLKKIVAELLMTNRNLKTRIKRYKSELREMSQLP